MLFLLCETGTAAIELYYRDKNHNLMNDIVTQQAQEVAEISFD